MDFIILTVYAIEPLMMIIAYNTFLDSTNDEELNRKKNIIKGIYRDSISFILLYNVIMVKQHIILYDSNSMLFVLLPICVTYIIPKTVYKVRNVINIIQVLISMFTLFLVGDAVILTILMFKSFPSNVVSLIVKTVELITFLLFIKYIKNYQKNAPKKIMLFFYMVISSVSNWIALYMLPENNSIRNFAFCIQLLILGLFVIYTILVFRQQEQQQEQFEKIINNIKTANEELKILRHDVTGHYNILTNLFQQKELNEFASELKKDLNNNCLVCTSSNLVLAYSISDALKIANKHNINFDYRLLTERIPLNTYEQNIIMQNILSNSVEANLRSDNITKRFIKLKISINQYEETVIDCSNYSENYTNAESSLKKDKTRHGLGLKSIKKIVKRHKGKIIKDYNEQENTFRICILLKGEYECAENFNS